MSDEDPCFTIWQMAQIPDDVLPDFLAELPDLLRHARQIEASADELGVALRAAAPWPWRLLPLGLFSATVKAGIRRATFKNDKRGTITLKVRLSDKHPEFYSRTENLAGDAQAASPNPNPSGA
jgi:hypothetical protein